MARRNVWVLWAVLVCCLGSARMLLAAPEDKKEETQNKGLEELVRWPLQTVQGMDKNLVRGIFNLGEIKIAGSRLSSSLADEKIERLPHNASVLTAEEMENRPAGSLVENLSFEEAVTYSDDLGLGLSARLDLRGFGGEAKQNLVLFDGVRAVEPFDNSATWHLYPQEYLKRVEINRGGASTLYGEGALSGVIRFETKDPTKEPHLKFDNSYGSFDTHKHFVEASGRMDRLGVYVGSHYAATDGYRLNSDHEGASVLLKTDYEWQENIGIKNSFYYADHKTGIAGPLTEAEMLADRRQKDPEGQFGDHFDDELFQDALGVHVFIEPIGVEVSNLTGYRSRQQNSLQSFGGVFGGTSDNDIGTESFSNVLQAAWRWESKNFDSRFIGGFEWNKDDIHNPTVFESFSFGPFRSDRSIDRRMLGAYLQERMTLWDRLVIEAGTRWDSIDWIIYDLLAPELQKRKEAKDTSPSIGMSFRLFEECWIYGNLSNAFKVPDSNTLIFETPNIFSPNPNIDPQKARHSELGARWEKEGVAALRGAFFYIETKKEILFNDITNINENFDTRRQGVELAGEWEIVDGLKALGTYTYTDATFDNGTFDQKKIPLVPRSQWSAGVLWEPVKRLVLRVGAQGVNDQFALNDFNNIFPMRDYWTLNGSVSYHQNHWELYAKGQNLLDKDFSTFVTSNGVDIVNYNPSPGIYLEAGVRIDI